MADPLDFGERLSRKVLASLRSLNASLGEVRVSVAKIDSIAHQRLTISSSAAGSPGRAAGGGAEQPFSAVAPARDAAVPSTPGSLELPVLRQLLLSPSLQGAGLDEGVLSELQRVLDPETLVAVRRHVEPRPGASRKETRGAATWHAPGGATIGGRRRGQPPGGGGGYSSEEDTGTGASPGGAPADGEAASEDQTLAQARRYRQRSTRGTDKSGEGGKGGSRQPSDDEEDSDASADFDAAAGGSGRQPPTASVGARAAAAPPPPPLGGGGAAQPVEAAAALALASAMNQRQRIDAFQAASPARSAPALGGGGGDAGAAALVSAVTYAFPRYSDPPAEAIEDDGEDDDIPVSVSEVQEVGRVGFVEGGGGRGVAAGEFCF